MNEEEKIREFFKDHNFLSCRKFLKLNDDCKKYCEAILNENKKWDKIENVAFYYIFKNEILKKCPICNSEIHFSKRHSTYCSRKCSNNSIHCYNHSIFLTDNPMKHKHCIMKAKKTSLMLYDCFSKQAGEFYDKIINAWKDYVIPLFSKSEYLGKQHIYKWKCAKCGNTFESDIHTTHFLENIDISLKYIPRCFNCYPSTFGKSKPELELFEFCKETFQSLSKHKNKNVRNFIKNFEIDILIPEIKLAIEFNGLRFHSTKEIYNKQYKLGYHLEKTIKCNEKGYRLIHIWEDEWDDNKENVKKKLIDIFLGNEDLNFTDEQIKLDRSWYNNIEIPNYELIRIEDPEIIKRKKFDVENCGYLIYFKK